MTMGKRRTSDYNNNTIVWHVPYREGRIEARGFNDGKEAARFELRTAGKPSRIELLPDRTNISADGQDLSHITIQITDDKGVAVPDADQLITLEISGAGKLKGLDNGDLRRAGSFSGNKVRTYFGKALATIQSTRNKGEIVVGVTAEGLPRSTVTITSNSD
jgi:beta-galactosidase